MSAMSDYLENEILDHILGTGAYTMPTTVYVGLSTGSFNDDNSATFSVAASGTTSNSGAIEFNPATGSSWGSISHFGIFDALTSGNLLIHGSFTTAKTIDVGDILKIAIGDLDVTAA